MIYKLVVGVVNAVSESFGEDYSIYVDKIPQGFIAPAFFVNTIRTSNKRQIDNNYLISHSLDVTYYPKDKENPNEELYKAIDILNLALEVVTMQDLGMVRAENMHSVVDDGELHYLVDYNFRVFVPKDKTLMETLAITKIDTKGDKD